MSPYRRILSVPRMPALLASSVLARLPLAVNSLAIVLFLQHETGSFAIAGAASGACGLGIGLGSIVMSRVVDRGGRAILLPLAIVQAVFVGVLVLAGADGWPAAPLVLLAGAAGFSIPPTSSVLRTLYPVALGGDARLMSAAFALDSVITDFTWVVGPLLVAAFVALIDPAAALIFSAGASIAGIALFIAGAASLHPVAPADGAPKPSRGALASPGVVTITLATVPLGFTFGALEVAIPAFTKAIDAVDYAGLILALYAIGSMGGALILGSRERRTSLTRVHLTFSAALPVSVAVLLVADSPLVMALLVIPAGLVTGPLIASRNELTGRVALPGTETEAYSWPMTALFSGTAIGAAVAGVLVDGPGWRAGVLCAAGVALAGTLIAAVRRRSLD